MNAKISIVIRSNNEADSLKKVIPKIYSQKNISNIEIILIDSIENLEKSKDLIKIYKIKAIKISQKNFTHAWTFNLGVKNSSGKIIVFISAHCLPVNDYWLYNLTKHFKDRRVGGVYGAQIPIKGVNLIDEFKLGKMFPLDKDSKSPAKFSNANGAILKRLLTKYPYDEKVFYQYMGGEDQKLIDPIKDSGYKIVYDPDSKVYHMHKYSLKNRINSSFIEGYYAEEFKNWNQGIVMLAYSKRELMGFLFKRREYKLIFINLLLHGILIRIVRNYGRIKRIIDEKVLQKNIIPFYDYQKKEYSLYKY